MLCLQAASQDCWLRGSPLDTGSQALAWRSEGRQFKMDRSHMAAPAGCPSLGFLSLGRKEGCCLVPLPHQAQTPATLASRSKHSTRLFVRWVQRGWMALLHSVLRSATFSFPWEGITRGREWDTLSQHAESISPTYYLLTA